MKNGFECYKDFFGYFNAPKTNCDIVASYLLTFLNFVLDYSNNLFIWNQTKPRFPPYNPKNMVRTSPHFLIRSGGPEVGMYIFVDLQNT
jgi:hypothetical protein